jgi:hypothetical protein
MPPTGGVAMTKVIRRETRKRGVLGKIVKWSFILFNLLMVFLLLKTCAFVGSQTTATGDVDADTMRTAGTAIGGGIAGTAILFFWALGNVILAPVTYFTRGPSVITEETVD